MISKLEKYPKVIFSTKTSKQRKKKNNTLFLAEQA